MKNNTIEELLERYRQGTLDDKGRESLERLTQRDEVMAAAGQRAAGIIRRRRSAALAVAGLLVAGGAAWMLLPAEGAAEPMLVAETTVPEATPDFIPNSPTVETAGAIESMGTIGTMGTPKEEPAVNTRRAVPKDEAPVVVCNNQCEADSVISDIWKFLTV